MALRFYNTLTQQVETFTPLHGNVVRMYSCGPTVYNYAHIGNLRAFTFPDILRRWLRLSGYTLDDVMNITDIDDKIIRDAAAAGKTIFEFTQVYTDAFIADRALLRLEPPAHLVKATDHIAEMAAAIQKLGERGYTYERRLHLLPHRELPHLRQAVAQRFQRHPRRRARGRRRIR